MIEQVIISTQADTSCAEQEYQGLRGEIVSLKKQLDLLEEGTEEYTKTFTQLSNKMFEQRERTLALKNSSADLGKLLGNVSGIAGTISQGFAGATSALSLFGIESEELVKTIQKVQALESLARTFESFEDAPKKVKALINNIKGLLRGAEGSLKLDIQTEVAAPKVEQVIQSKPDTQAYAEAAKSAQVIQTASAATAASATTAAAANTQSSAAQVKDLVNTAEKFRIANSINSVNWDNLEISKLENSNLLKNIKLSNEKIDYSKLAQEGFLINQKEELDNIKDQADAQAKVTDEVKKTGKETEVAGKAASSFGNALKGALVGLGITAVITGITLAISYLVKQYEKHKQQLKDTLDFNKQISDETAKNSSEQVATLTVLNFNYNKYKDSQKESNKYLIENKDAYLKVGIEVDKIIKGEITYSEAIKKSNNLLQQRAENMTYFNQLVKETETKVSLETNISLLADQIAAGKVAYDDVSSELIKYYAQLEVTDKKIDFLSRKITTLPKESDKTGDSKTTSTLKTQSELLIDILNLRKQIQLANPIDSEYFRNLENEFDNLKESARLSYIALINSGIDPNTALIAYNNMTTSILESQKIFNEKYQEGVRKNAEWVRDNEIRTAQETIKLQEDKYSTVLKAVEESFKGGVISKDQFEKDFADIQKAVGTSFKTTKEFYEYMEKKFPTANKPFNDFINSIISDVNSGKKDLETAKKEIEDTFKIDLTPDPGQPIDTGTLSDIQYEFIQKWLDITDTYNQAVSDSNKKSRDDNRKINKEILDDKIQLNEELFNIALSEIEKERNLANTKYYDSILNATGFDKFKRGDATFDFLIREQQAIIDTENARQLKLENDIKLIDENIKLYDKDSQAYIDAVKAKQEAEAELTQSQLTEAEAQAKINDIKFQKFMSTIDDIQTIVGEFGNAIKSIYEAQETLGLANLKKLLNARKITQDQYEKEADALSLKYAKKRQQTEIFQGLLAATSTSISAFSSAMRPDSGLTWPYNLIAAGATSAAAFAAVIAQVATLRSLSVDSSTTSVNPTSSNTGLGLTYQLNQQDTTAQRIINSMVEQRVYVLESDITATQAKIREIEEMSTF